MKAKNINRYLKGVKRDILLPLLFTVCVIVICCVSMLVSKITGAATPAEHKRLSDEDTGIQFSGVETISLEHSPRELNDIDNILDEPIDDMNAIGSFDIEYKGRCVTSTFRAKENRLRVVTQAMFGDKNSLVADVNEDKQFVIELYHVTANGLEHVSGYVGNCDNIEGGLGFDVAAGEEYELLIMPKNFNSFECLEGHGHVYPIQ